MKFIPSSLIILSRCKMQNARYLFTANFNDGKKALLL